MDNLREDYHIFCPLIMQLFSTVLYSLLCSFSRKISMQAYLTSSLKFPSFLYQNGCICNTKVTQIVFQAQFYFLQQKLTKECGSELVFIFHMQQVPNYKVFFYLLYCFLKSNALLLPEGSSQWIDLLYFDLSIISLPLFFFSFSHPSNPSFQQISTI